MQKIIVEIRDREVYFYSRDEELLQKLVGKFGLRKYTVYKQFRTWPVTYYSYFNKSVDFSFDEFIKFIFKFAIEHNVLLSISTNNSEEEV